jgi:hypothetical protein
MSEGLGRYPPDVTVALSTPVEFKCGSALSRIGQVVVDRQCGFFWMDTLMWEFLCSAPAIAKALRSIDVAVSNST